MKYSHPESDDYAGLDGLPDELPADPLGVLEAWLAQSYASGDHPNPNAMALATADSRGRPSVRIVLCKEIVRDPGHIVFFTNYESRKGVELDGNPFAAAVFHWDGMERQVRIEGPVVRSPAPESDAYFASRPLDRRLGAWASRQSRPIESREALLIQVMEVAMELGVTADLDALGDAEASEDIQVARPDHWGGYRLIAEAVELWVGGRGRIHDRARWERSVSLGGNGDPVVGSWATTRLQP